MTTQTTKTYIGYEGEVDEFNRSTLFDYAASVRARDAGMENAAHASGCQQWIGQARAIAAMLAAKEGEVTINDIYAKIGLPPRLNAAGSVFKDKRFKCIGIKESSRPERHAGIIRRWALA